MSQFVEAWRLPSWAGPPSKSFAGYCPMNPQHGPTVTAFLLKAQAIQKWNSQDIVALLEKPQ